MDPVVILETDVFARKALEAVLAQEGFGAACRVLGSAEGVQASAVLCVGENTSALDIASRDQFQKPLRIGALLDRVKRLGDSTQRQNALRIGHFTLMPGSFDLQHDDGTLVRLTEKEQAILQCLAKNDGAIVERRALLDEVWGYAQNVETHTLETHIYRLRQKIERDPAVPKILLTVEPGYKLSS